MILQGINNFIFIVGFCGVLGAQNYANVIVDSLAQMETTLLKINNSSILNNGKNIVRLNNRRKLDTLYFMSNNDSTFFFLSTRLLKKKTYKWGVFNKNLGLKDFYLISKSKPAKLRFKIVNSDDSLIVKIYDNIYDTLLNDIVSDYIEIPNGPKESDQIFIYKMSSYKIAMDIHKNTFGARFKPRFICKTSLKLLHGRYTIVYDQKKNICYHTFDGW